MLACLSWLPTVQAKDGAPLREIISDLDLDPVSLITLFFDEPEKELLDKSGDLTLLSGLGLFVNPSTLWNEYKTLLPGQGLEYYNPGKSIKSSIESHQVNTFIVTLGNGHRNKGLIVDLYALPGRRSLWFPKDPSWEWWLLRPLMLAALIVIAGVSEDFWGIGAIGALLLGQFVAISKSVLDAKKLPQEGDNKEIQTNVFFLSNNVTMIVRCRGDLFRQGTSHLTSRTNDPVVWRIITTITFLAGILFVGFTELNFKIAYLSAHALQAILIAIASKQPVEERVIINRTVWEQTANKEAPKLERRREAYVWACKATGVMNTKWLQEWDLAAGPTLDWVNAQLANGTADRYVIPQRKDASDVDVGEKV